MIREEKVAGLFYRAKKEELEYEIKRFLDEIVDADFVDIKGVIVPHAGYQYSGKTAAFAYYALKHHHFKRIIIIGPSHHGGDDKFYLPSFSEYKTPLGSLNVDEEMVAELSSKSGFSRNDFYEKEEHSIEVQLPFLQIMLPNFKIVPILFAKQTKDNADLLFEHLIDYIDDETLVVISTDLSHYYSFNVAKEKDKLLIDDLLSLNSNRMKEDFLNDKIEACGIGGIFFAIRLAKHFEMTIKPLKYGNSGEVNNDFSEVVGYFSGIIGKERC